MGISQVNRGLRTSLGAEMPLGTISGGDISFSRKTEHTEEEKKEKESKKEKKQNNKKEKFNEVDTFLRYIYSFYYINTRYILKKVLALGEILSVSSRLGLGRSTLRNNVRLTGTSSSLAC